MRSMHRKKKPPRPYRVRFSDPNPVLVDNRGLQVKVTMSPRPGRGCDVRLWDCGDMEWCWLEVHFGPHCTMKELKRKIRSARLEPLTFRKV